MTVQSVLVSLGAGLLAGVIYSLLRIRSPAPPAIALVGLLGMLAGEAVVVALRGCEGCSHERVHQAGVADMSMTVLKAIAAILVAGLTICGTPARAAAPQVRTQGPGFYRIMLGDFEVTALLDGTHAFPAYTVLQRATPDGGSALLSATNPGETDALLAAVDLRAPPEGSINAFLINTGAQLVLIDSGAGALYGACCGHLLDNLRASGYRPEQVDAVLLTHLHADHVGGVLATGGAAFPNAVVRVSRRDADYWLDAANEIKAPPLLLAMFAGAQKSLKPYRDAGRFQPFEDGASLFPGIRAQPTPGHTPGHSAYVVESRGEKLLVWGDIVHVAPVQFPDPGVTVTYDSDAGSAERQRDALFAAAAQSHEWIAAAHIAFPGLGHVGVRDTHFVWIPADYTTMPATP